MPTIDDFLSELRSQFRMAQDRGARYVTINAGELHRRVGGYPSHSHRMPLCCDAMYHERQNGDEIIAAPPKGKGARLTIRYSLPRQRHP
jgi:hypothetical protein